MRAASVSYYDRKPANKYTRRRDFTENQNGQSGLLDETIKYFSIYEIPNWAV